MTIYNYPIGPQRLNRIAALKKYIDVAAQKHGVEREDILSEIRWRPAVKARQDVMYYGNRVLKLSLPRVGAVLNRDHTTVLHGVRVWEAQLNG